MNNRCCRVRELELCNRAMFGDLVLTCQSPPAQKSSILEHRPRAIFNPLRIRTDLERECMDTKRCTDTDKRRASVLVDQLLVDIYSNTSNVTDYTSATSSKSRRSCNFDARSLQEKDTAGLLSLAGCLEEHVVHTGSVLVRRLKRRDALRRQREAHCDVITSHLRKLSVGQENSDMRFSIEPAPGDSGFSQWHTAMRMVAQLPEGIPPEFRSRLWLTLAEKHLLSRGIDWKRVEKTCFSEWSHPDDAELGVQIVKDLHRTGCSLFCGEGGQENQALLKRVLLAYARWNKSVGYCQGFNMLAALILQVTEKCETDALKLMIYLIEGVLPESYFADSLRGLSVDMAVFRELLRTRLPRLSRHLDKLQSAARDGTTSYEPPLTNVFTMQWFLTLFCNCLPQPTVLRVWDLIFLEGNEVLLRTALAIWQALAERIMFVRNADEFYCIMGVLTREMLEFGLVDANSLIKSVVTIGNLSELDTLRERYLYNINPWANLSSGSDFDRKVEDRQVKLYPKEGLALDISALKKQYAKLKQRQRQAHIIFSAAVARQPSRPPPVVMNHLLLGKSALLPARRIGPPKGAIPPARQPPATLHWKDEPQHSSSSSSSDTELCDDPEDTVGTSPIPIENSSPVEDSCIRNRQLQEDNLMNTDNISSDLTDNVKNVPENTCLNLKYRDDFETVASADQILNKPLELYSQRSPSDGDIINSPVSTNEPSELFDFGAYGLQQPENLTESEDEGFDFEKFLEDRVESLKQRSLEHEDSENLKLDGARVNFGGKNSQRALQIIQENSLILHRILQCQSRLTPSPPADNVATTPVTSNLELLKAEMSKEIEEEITTISPTNIDDYARPSISVGLLDKGEYDNDLDRNPCDTLIQTENIDSWLNSNTENRLLYKHKFSSQADISPGTILTNLFADGKTNTSKISECLDNNLSGKLDYSQESVCSKPTKKHLGDIFGENEKAYREDNVECKTNCLELESTTISKDISVHTSYYNNILDTEFSRTLEERYNNLMSKSSSTEIKGNHHIFSSYDNYLQYPTSPDKSNEACLDLDTNKSSGDNGGLKLSKSTSSTELRSIAQVSSNYDKYLQFQIYPEDLNDTCSNIDAERKSPILKSHEKIYNPFPVKLSSRQNKEVAVRLGLYKK